MTDHKEVSVVEQGVVVVKRRVFPPLLCAIVSGPIPWRFSFRFTVSFRRAVYRGPSLKHMILSRMFYQLVLRGR